MRVANVQSSNKMMLVTENPRIQIITMHKVWNAKYSIRLRLEKGLSYILLYRNKDAREGIHDCVCMQAEKPTSPRPYHFANLHIQIHD